MTYDCFPEHLATFFFSCKKGAGGEAGSSLKEEYVACIAKSFLLEQIYMDREGKYICDRVSCNVSIIIFFVEFSFGLSVVYFHLYRDSAQVQSLEYSVLESGTSKILILCW